MKFYIATRLENYAKHNELRDMLVADGHEITYDWTVHGPVWRNGMKAIRDVALLERGGVRDADFVAALLPGGRGTHAEIGMALAYEKFVFATGPAEMFGATPETCAFYHDPLVVQCESLASIVAQANVFRQMKS